MQVLTCASTGKSITLLGEPIADSGEGKIWRTDSNGYLAKIYNLPTPGRVQKLAVMISHPPQEPNSHLNHTSFAWPKSVLRNSQGDFVGFLMPEIRDGKELIDVYSPKRRKIQKLEVDWRFLHITTRNIASIIASLHANGYVLGDIKPQNILVNNRALPSIIDTDSFQVRNPKNGSIYRCPVGSADYTPPELMGQDFSTIDQTEVHDRFRLAVIIYQMLFGGESPFSGKWMGRGETPANNELIRRGLWLYSPNGLLQPVERTIPLDIVHPEIQRCFLKCFNDGYHNPHLRPTAREWLQALKVASDELILCGKIDSHYYNQSYGKCYWCDRATKFHGVDIFPGNAIPIPKPIPNPSIQNLTTTKEVGNAIPKPKPIPNPSIQNLATTEEVRTLEGHSKMVCSACFSPNREILASGSADHTIKLWNVSTGRQILTLQGHSGWVASLALTPDGKTLASGSRDHTIKLWDVATGRQILTLKGHSGWVVSLAITPDGKTLASGSWDKTIRLWDVVTGSQICTLQAYSEPVVSLAFTPDGKTLASGALDTTINMWDLYTGRQICILQGHSNRVVSLDFTPDGKTLASGSWDKTIRLWNVTTGSQIRTLQGHSDEVISLCITPDGKTLASGRCGKTIKIWQSASFINEATSSPISVNSVAAKTHTHKQVQNNTSQNSSDTNIIKNHTHKQAQNNTSQNSPDTNTIGCFSNLIMAGFIYIVNRLRYIINNDWIFILGILAIIIAIIILINYEDSIFKK